MRRRDVPVRRDRSVHHLSRRRDNDDEDALAGSHADERQQLLGLRSWALAGKVAILAAFAGVVAAVAARAGWWWPVAAIFAVTGFVYLLGLSNYGVGEEGPDDDADDGHRVRSRSATDVKPGSGAPPDRR
jgi:hypothetical protein